MSEAKSIRSKTFYGDYTSDDYNNPDPEANNSFDHNSTFLGHNNNEEEYSMSITMLRKITTAPLHQRIQWSILFRQSSLSSVWRRPKVITSELYDATRDSSRTGPPVPFRELHEDLKAKEKAKASVADLVKVREVSPVVSSEVSHSSATEGKNKRLPILTIL